MLRSVARSAVRIAIAAARVDLPTLTRGDGSIVEWESGGLGKLETDAELVDGRQHRQHIEDAATLIVFAKPLDGVLPEIGEIVDLICDRQQRRFVVTANPPEPTYRYMDQFRIGIRIHLKEVDIDPDEEPDQKVPIA